MSRRVPAVGYRNRQSPKRGQKAGRFLGEQQQTGTGQERAGSDTGQVKQALREDKGTAAVVDPECDPGEAERKEREPEL